MTLFTAILAIHASGAAEQPKKTAEPWYYKLGRILGLDRAPIALKGPVNAQPGELWLTPVNRIEPRKLTDGADYISPAFQPGRNYLFALRGNDLVRVPVAGGAAESVRRLPGAIKLVGFDAQDPDRVLVLFQSGQPGDIRTVDVALLSVSTGKRRIVAAHRAAGSEEIEALLGWQRGYGKVYVRPQGGEIVLGGVETVEIPVSDCRDFVCGQPAYSPQRQEVAFIRSLRWSQ